MQYSSIRNSKLSLLSAGGIFYWGRSALWPLCCPRGRFMAYSLLPARSLVGEVSLLSTWTVVDFDGDTTSILSSLMGGGGCGGTSRGLCMSTGMSMSRPLCSCHLPSNLQVAYPLRTHTCRRINLYLSIRVWVSAGMDTGVYRNTPRLPVANTRHGQA